MKLLIENWRKYLNEEDISRTEQYIKHAALNAGMVARNIVGARDKNLMHRLKEIFNDFYYTIVPPWTHHSDEELQSMKKNTAWKWFKCGYMENDEQYEEECL